MNNWREKLGWKAAAENPLEGTILKFWSIRYTVEFGYGYYYYGRFTSKQDAELCLDAGSGRKFQGDRDTKVVLKDWAYYRSGWIAT